MKKVLVFCLTVVFMASMTLTAFAAPGAFVKSPTGNPAPTVIEFKCADEGCTARLVITPYGERKKLSAFLQDLLNKMYDLIKGTNDLTTLNADLAKLAKDKNIKGTNLAVSDLFDIHYEGCDNHEEHHDFDIVLSADSLKNFVGLLHMKSDGTNTIELIKGAKVTGDGDHLAFSVGSFSPFAVVIDTSANPSQTGDDNLIPVYASVMAVSALGIILILVKSKKQSA